MAVLVQKFGGSSLATTEHINHVANRVIDAAQAGHQVVVVVSAMGQQTNWLSNQAHALSPIPHPASLDWVLSAGEQISSGLLSIALREKGVEAHAMNGQTAGIYTNNQYNNAHILTVDPQKIRAFLEKKAIVVVTGFQGVDKDGNITTLGRGGSDTTAVALAAALNAAECQIYTDVAGVYTADPRKVKQAKLLPQISFDQMVQMAHLGAQVLKPHAVRLAKKHATQLRVLSTFETGQGTLINNEYQPILGFAMGEPEQHWCLIHPGVVSSADILAFCHANHVVIDRLTQQATNADSFNLQFVLPTAEQDKMKRLKTQLMAYSQATYCEVVKSGTRISMVGVDFESIHLAERGCALLNTQKIATQVLMHAETKVSILVDDRQAVDALNALHAAFLETNIMKTPACSNAPVADNTRTMEIESC